MRELENKTALVTGHREELAAQRQQRLRRPVRTSWSITVGQDRKRSPSLSRSEGKVAMPMQSRLTWELRTVLRC